MFAKASSVFGRDERGNSPIAGPVVRAWRAVPATLGSVPATLKFTYKKLVTKEDRDHLHKTLGILAIISYIYRYCYLYPRVGNLGFEGTYFDWATMTLHMALSTSSLIFHVLKKRILSRPMVIWEEYRLHAIVFSLRCASVFLFGYFRPFRGSPYEHFALPSVVLTHHLVVDEITRRYGSKEHTTVRVKDNYSWGMWMVLRIYSFYQFVALASQLTPHERLMDIGFNALIAIQSSAFLMTLYRKGLILYYTHAFWYSLCLAISSYHFYLMRPDPVFLLRIVCVFFLRTKMGMNKYLLWTLFVLVSFEPTSSALGARLSHIYARLPVPEGVQGVFDEWI